MKVEISIKRKNKCNVFLINGQELTFYWSVKRIDELEALISALFFSISICDYKKVSLLLLENRDKNLTNLLKAAEKVYKVEYHNFVYSICDLFVTKKERFTVTSIFNFMMSNSIDLDNWNTKSTPHYLNRIDFRNIVTTYIDNNLIDKIKIGLEQMDKNIVWLTIPKVHKSYLFNKLKNDLSDQLHFFVKGCGKEYSIKNKPVNYYKFVSYCLIGKEDEGYTKLIFKYLKSIPIFKEVVKEIMLSYLQNKREEYKFNEDEWIIIDEKKVQSIQTVTLVFSDIKPELKNEVKQYIQHTLNTSVKRKGIQSNLKYIKTVLNELDALSYNEINSLTKINYYHVLHLVNHFQQLKKPDNTRMYSLGTIRGIFTAMRLIIDWVICSKSLKMNNPFRKYKFQNAHSFVETSNEYIPEEIIEQLKNKLNEAPLYVQNIWTIMINTGMRVSEALKLEADCLLPYNKKIEMYELKYQPSKSQQARANNGQDKNHIIPVNSAVVDAIDNQIDLSSKLRSSGNTNKIFLTENKSIVTQPKPSSIAGHINRLSKKHMIKDANGEVFHFKNHMCRKTLIVELLTKGETLEAVADYVNHLSEETTRRHYAEIERKKRAELDNAMFEKLFEETIDEKIKKQFSFNEKKSLINEITLGVRETPEGHGYCTKHVSFGPCQKKSCVGCKMLITGPQKLPMWYKLYKEQEIYLSELAVEYQMNDVDDYEDHRLYQQQVRLLQIYKDTISKVEAFSLKEGIPIEKQSVESI